MLLQRMKALPYLARRHLRTHSLAYLLAPILPECEVLLSFGALGTETNLGTLGSDWGSSSSGAKGSSSDGASGTSSSSDESLGESPPESGGPLLRDEVISFGAAGAPEAAPSAGASSGAT